MLTNKLEIDITKDYDLTNEQQAIYNAMLKRGLDPHKYYDFVNDELIQLPPMSRSRKLELNRSLDNLKILKNEIYRKWGYK